MINGCEACSEYAELPFENILDRVTASDPSVTDLSVASAGPVFAGWRASTTPV